MEDKNKKIGIIALIFALLALTQASAISSVTMNLIAGSGINITQSGDNYTITTTGNTTVLPDDTKVNKSGDNVGNTFNLTTYNIDDINVYSLFDFNYSRIYLGSISSTYPSYGNGILLDSERSELSYSDGVNHKFGVDSSGVYSDSDLNMSGKNIINCGNCLTSDNDSQYLNISDAKTNIQVNNNISDLFSLGLRTWNTSYTNSNSYPITVNIRTRITNGLSGTPSNVITFTMNTGTYAINSNNHVNVANDYTFYYIVPSGGSYIITNTTRSGTPIFIIFDWKEGSLKLI